jgi:hypothetical protein
VLGRGRWAGAQQRNLREGNAAGRGCGPRVQRPDRAGPGQERQQVAALDDGGELSHALPGPARLTGLSLGTSLSTVIVRGYRPSTSRTKARTPVGTAANLSPPTPCPADECSGAWPSSATWAGVLSPQPPVRRQIQAAVPDV